jgi:hypothetical protein
MTLTDAREIDAILDEIGRSVSAGRQRPLEAAS